MSAAYKTILWAGSICGVLDGLSAVVLSAYFGGTPLRVFQGIAGALLGRGAFNGGLKTGVLAACV